MTGVTIRAAGNRAMLTLMGDVGYEITASAVAAALKTAGSAPLTVQINSYGGDAMMGIAIHNMLARHPAAKTVVIEGIAASAASLIAMAGDEIVMPANAFLMIHNAWGGAMGDADDMRGMADTLDLVSASYRRTYAARSGASEDQIAALMAADTWFTAEDALAAGFITQVSEPREIRADATRLARLNRVPAALTRLAQTINPPAAPASATMEVRVTDSPNTEAPQASAPVPIPSASLEQIQGIAARARLGADFVVAQLQAGATVQAVQDAAIDTIAAAAPAAGGRPRIEIGNDERATTHARMKSAIVASIRGKGEKDTPAEAREFRNIGIVGMMREMLAAAGDRTAHRLDNASLWDRIASASAGTHTTSDFPLILRDAANVSLQMEFGEFPRTFDAWASDTDVNDFKSINSAQIGTMPTLTRVAEGQAVPYRAIAEEGESYKVDTYAGIVALTREMIINDRLNAFGRMIRGAAGAAERALSDLVYLQITANANMADGNRLFSTAHLNIGANAAGTDYHYLFASDRPSVEVAYLGGRRAPEITEEEGFSVLGISYRVLFDFGAKAISWRGVTRERSLVNVDGSTVAPLEQLLLTMREVGGSLIGVPRNLVLLVPPGQHFPARRLVTAVTPTQASNVNIYGGLQLVVEPRLANTTVV